MNLEGVQALGLFTRIPIDLIKAMYAGQNRSFTNHKDGCVEAYNLISLWFWIHSLADIRQS